MGVELLETVVPLAIDANDAARNDYIYREAVPYHTYTIYTTIIKKLVVMR
jgi:hypothetical protein